MRSRQGQLVGCAVVLALLGCQLGDTAVYQRGDLGGGALVGDDDAPTSSSSSSASSSSGTPGFDASVPADADAEPDSAPESGPVPCIPFAPPAGWAYAARGTLNDYIATDQIGGNELNYLLAGELHFDLSQGQSNLTCMHCVKWVKDGKVYFQQSGISDVQAVNGCNTGLTATISNLVLREVTYEGNEYKTVAGGACLEATGVIQVNVPTACF